MPKTWPEVFEAAKKLKAAGYGTCGFSTAWITWAMLEQFSAWHNVPLATKANGLDGFDAELKINSPLHVRHLQTSSISRRIRPTTIPGRDSSKRGPLHLGRVPDLPRVVRLLRQRQGEREVRLHLAADALLPGRARRPAELDHRRRLALGHGRQEARGVQGVAKFFAFLSDTDRQARLHQESGYLPITKAAYEKTKAVGFYEKNPILQTPLMELTNKEPTENSRGLRLGNMVQMRDVWAEEIEAALAGQKSAKDALDAAVNRGNQMLRQFERTVSRYLRARAARPRDPGPTHQRPDGRPGKGRPKRHPDPRMEKRAILPNNVLPYALLFPSSRSR